MVKRKKQQIESSSDGGRFSAAARCLLPLSAVLCVAMAAAVWRYLLRSPQAQLHAVQEHQQELDVSELRVVPRHILGDMDYQSVAEKRLPIILTETVADRWPAREAFTASFLARKIPHLMAHRQESKRSFITFHDHKALEPLVAEKWEEFNLKVNTTIPEVLQWNNPRKSKQKGPYMYYSQDIATLTDQFPEVIGYVQPIQPLILSQENVQVNLWVGREGLVTHTHYDCTYNFFVQLQGKKRFTLFPPNQTLYLYPCLHPHYGHSQLDILKPDAKTHPKYSRSGGWVAEVSAGDMLVVPPFWFHHVETLEESVSVNVWSDAPEYATLNHIYSLPVPFEESWSWEDLVIATKLFIDMMIDSLDVGLSSHFISDLLEQRYKPLVSTGSLSVNISMVTELSEMCRHVDWQDKSQDLKSKFHGGLVDLVTLFKTMPTRDTMVVCLGNYLEHLVYSILGLNYVYPFLSTCALAR